MAENKETGSMFVHIDFTVSQPRSRLSEASFGFLLHYRIEDIDPLHVLDALLSMGLYQWIFYCVPVELQDFIRPGLFLKVAVLAVIVWLERREGKKSLTNDPHNLRPNSALTEALVSANWFSVYCRKKEVPHHFKVFSVELCLFIEKC